MRIKESIFNNIKQLKEHDKLIDGFLKSIITIYKRREYNDTKQITNPVFWAGFVAALAFFAKSFFDFELPQEELNTLVEAVLSLLAAFGIFNNPTSKDSV